MQPVSRKPLDLYFKLPDELKHAVFRDWGLFFQNLKEYHRALFAFRNSFDLNPNDYFPVERCSRCNYELCNIEQAVADIEKAIHLNTNPIIDLALYHHFVDCLLDQNHIERSIIESYRTLRKNDSHLNRSKCNDRLDYLQAIVNSTIGPISGPSLLCQRDVIRKVELKKANAQGGRVDICAALSGVYVAYKHIPLQERRTAVTSSLLNSAYLGSSGQDFEYITELAHSKILNLKQTTGSAWLLERTINEVLTDVLRWRNMLRIRAPMYTKHKPEEFRESVLYRVQFQTRRDIFKQLEQVRDLMIKNDLLEIEHTVRHILHDYYSIKTNRVFPRKFEFSNDLCNMVGLTHLRHLVIHSDLMTYPPYERINRLFNLKTLVETEEAHESQKNFAPVFGERIAATTFASDKSFLVTKRKLEMLITLDQLVKFSIEHCFVYYEMCELDLVLQKVDEALIQARKIVQNAKKCKNVIWSFLGLYMMARAEQLRRSFPSVQTTLTKMRNCARTLNNQVRHFTETAYELNDLDIQRRAAEERVKEEEKANDEKMRILKKEWLLKQSIMMPRAQFKAKFGDHSHDK